MTSSVPTHVRTTRHRRLVAVGGAAVAALAATLTATAVAPVAHAAAPAADKPVAFNGKPRFVTIPMRTEGRPPVAAAAAALPSLPTWSGSFTATVAGVPTNFPYTMIGSDPAGAGVTTTVANTITPINFKFGTVLMSSNPVNTTNVVNSGLFANKTFQTTNGQYGDIYMRTNFWTKINNGAKPWHVLMAKPVVRPALTFTIPSTAGRSVLLTSGVRIGVLDINYLDARLKTYVVGPSATVLSQLMATNIVLCNGKPATNLANCGILGYHSAWSTSTGKHTYSVSGYLSPKVFNDPTTANVSTMSHELGEWLADPYTTNKVPGWDIDPTAGVACSPLLEVGDGLEGKGVQIGTLFYQDLHYLPYFTRESPSTSWQGRYSWFKNDLAPATLC